MSKWMFAGCISVAAFALLSAGCAGVESGDDEATIVDAPAREAQDEIGTPDLISLNDSSDCGGFYVKNIGGISAGPTTLRVKYTWRVPGANASETKFFSIPSLAPGAQHLVTYYPAACVDFDGDCDFTMTADSSNVVWEFNESNNVLTTYCLFDP
jgi:hypothetical protein